MLTERREHLEVLAERLRNEVHDLVILTGGMGAKARREAAARLGSIPTDAPRLILASGQFAGEGFDDPRLDTLFLALPGAIRGPIATPIP